MSLNLPTPIASYFEAVNAYDVNAMLAAFSDGASVRDEGRDMTGRIAIREWIDDTTRKYRITVMPTGVDRADQRTILTVQVSGSFPGSPIQLRYHFIIIGEKIARLEIN